MLYSRRSIFQMLIGFLGASASLPALLNGDAKGGDSSEVALQLILVGTSKEAGEIRKLLSAGEDFGLLASEYSIDASAHDLGYKGEVRFAGLPRAVRDALKGLVPGQVTAVIQTPSGFIILKLLSEAASSDLESWERNRRLAAAAQTGIRSVTLTGESNYYVLKAPARPSNWDQHLRTICQRNIQALDRRMHMVEADLARAEAQRLSEPEPLRLVVAEDHLAGALAYQGNMEKAIQHWEAAYKIVASAGHQGAQNLLEERLGIAWLQQAAIENSANGVHLNSSIFPIAPKARYKVVSGAGKAVTHFRKYLQRDPEDLEVKWLLNLAYMTLGEYPGEVPRPYRLPLAPFESKEDIGRFENVAPSLGLNRFGIAGGIIVDDFDNDGFLDVVTSCMDPCAPMRYFHNNGDGTFTDRSDASGLSKQLGGLNILQADYDNDGRLDILVLRGAWTVPMRKSLLRNNGDGTFTDVTRECGLAVPATSTQTAAWADFDNDGHIDLFIGNEDSPSQLFRNKGDGTFVDVGPMAGINRIQATKGVTAGDYDNDGYTDFYVSNLQGKNFLYHNNRNGTFTDRAQELHVELPLCGFQVWYWDYDNDGWLDLFVTSYYMSVSEVVASYLGLPVRAEGMKLYKNTGKGTFVDVSKQAGLDRVFMPMGCNFGDIDNDGFLDFYLGTGAPPYGALVPNVFFRNHEGKYFADITASSGTGFLQKGHGVAFADINNDGLEELLIVNGGMVPGDKAAMAVFRNPGNTNHWISIRLIGVKTNRATVGARIKITLETEDRRRREVHRVVGSGGSFGSSPLQQHIGLGKAKRIDALEIWWPTSNTRQVFHDVRMNQFIEVKEFGKNLRKLNRPSFKL